jgi:cytochrome b561
MKRPHHHKNPVSRILARLKHGILIALLILIPFAGVFHPKLRKQENPEDKEIGTEE